MRLLSKRVHTPGRDGRPVFPGFVTYLSATEPLLMHRHGWVDASDTYDDFADSFSDDNGATWTEPRMKLQSHQVEGGRIRYAENACFFDEVRGKLLTFCSRGFYPDEGYHADTKFSLASDAYDPATGQWRGEEEIAHGLPGGLQISFCFPIRTRGGRLLVPAMTMLLDEEGNARHYPGCWAPMHASFTLRGTWDAEGKLQWECGRPVEVDPEKTSRGHCENTLAELADGRLAMVMRGDNSMYPERPGYKWHCFSEDEGLTWSVPEPLGCSDGSFIESGSNGSALVRSSRTGKLYWIGNLALDGERAKGNWPRSPLVIAEVQEEPFALIRETITIIDRRGENEPPLTQMSNFRFYQERPTGDILVYLARFGEKDPDNFKLADYYEYRVSLD
ncbi:MAG: sialidase family protein [Armatimonadia bacterium]